MPSYTYHIASSVHTLRPTERDDVKGQLKGDTTGNFRSNMTLNPAAKLVLAEEGEEVNIHGGVNKERYRDPLSTVPRY